MYRDERIGGFDAAAVVEVIEHLDAPRLSAFERVLLESARPATAIITTPNSEYNPLFETLPAGQFRHRDHGFEWTRAESSSGAIRWPRDSDIRCAFSRSGQRTRHTEHPLRWGLSRG